MEITINISSLFRFVQFVFCFIWIAFGVISCISILNDGENDVMAWILVVLCFLSAAVVFFAR